MLEVLEAADAKDLVMMESKLLTKEEIFTEHIMFPMTPVVEPYVSENCFLPKDPVLMGREAWGNNIDCLIGGTSTEGTLGLFFGDNFYEHMQKPESFVLYRELGLDKTKPADNATAAIYGEKLKKFYFGDSPVTKESMQDYLKVMIR